VIASHRVDDNAVHGRHLATTAAGFAWVRRANDATGRTRFRAC